MGEAREAEKMKKTCSNCGKVGSGDKNFSKCATCELTRYCSRDCQKSHWKVRLTRSDSLFNTLTPFVLRSSQEHKDECNKVVINCWFAAAQNGRVDDIERLLKRVFKVNSKLDHEGTNNKGLTALYYAVEGGHVEVRSDEERRYELTTPVSKKHVRTSVLIPPTLFAIHAVCHRL